MRGSAPARPRRLRWRSAGVGHGGPSNGMRDPEDRRFGVELAGENVDRRIRRGGQGPVELSLQAERPRGNKPDRAADPAQFGRIRAVSARGRSARAVTQSTARRPSAAIDSIAAGVNDGRRAGRPRDLAQERASCAGRCRCRWTRRRRRRRAGWRRPGRESRRRSRGRASASRPSAQRQKLGASAMWRVQTVGKLDAEMSWCRRQRASRST